MDGVGCAFNSMMNVVCEPFWGQTEFQIQAY